MQAWILYSLFYGYLCTLQKLTVLINPSDALQELPSLTQSTRTPWDFSSLRGVFSNAVHTTRISWRGASQGPAPHPTQSTTSVSTAKGEDGREAREGWGHATGSSSPTPVPTFPLEQWFDPLEASSPVTVTGGQLLHVVPNRSRSPSYTWSHADAFGVVQAKQSSFDVMQHQQFARRASTVPAGSDEDSIIEEQQRRRSVISRKRSLVCPVESQSQKTPAPALYYISGALKKPGSTTDNAQGKSGGTKSV
ncbi:unnamed protein product [Ixodes persulcatus]